MSRCCRRRASASYPHTAVKDVPLELLDRYFYAQEDDYVLSQAIRDMVRVSNHNLIKDPPFSRVDHRRLPQPADLLQPEPAATPDSGLPLRVASERLAVPGLGREHRGPQRSLRYGREFRENLSPPWSAAPIGGDAIVRSASCPLLTGGRRRRSAAHRGGASGTRRCGRPPDDGTLRACACRGRPR